MGRRGGPGPLARLLPRRQLRLIVCPRTLLRWHADLDQAAVGLTSPHTVRPRAAAAVWALVLEMARDNPGWGYRRAHGELTGFGYKRTRKVRVALRWRGSGLRTDTTHCPISAHPPQR
jgi:hypothetical protein